MKRKKRETETEKVVQLRTEWEEKVHEAEVFLEICFEKITNHTGELLGKKISYENEKHWFALSFSSNERLYFKAGNNKAKGTRLYMEIDLNDNFLVSDFAYIPYYQFSLGNKEIPQHVEPIFLSVLKELKSIHQLYRERKMIIIPKTEIEERIKEKRRQIEEKNYKREYISAYEKLKRKLERE